MIIMTKNKSSLSRRILRFSLCTVLICSLIFVTGCSRNDDNLIFRGGISDLIQGSSESGGGLSSLFSSLGAEYAEESDPLNAILDAVIVQFEANGYTDVKIYFINSAGTVKCIRATTKRGVNLYGWLLQQKNEASGNDKYFISIFSFPSVIFL